MQKACHNFQFLVIRFAEILSKTTKSCLGKDEQSCTTMRQLAVFVVKLQTAYSIRVPILALK
jgi:hypothetical protein